MWQRMYVELTNYKNKIHYVTHKFVIIFKLSNNEPW